MGLYERVEFIGRPKERVEEGIILAPKEIVVDVLKIGVKPELKIIPKEKIIVAVKPALVLKEIPKLKIIPKLKVALKLKITPKVA
ncbi:unnamed protein product, partial [marine sediment metagenome]